MTIQVYSKPICPYCDRAKELLKARGLSYEEIRVDLDADKMIEMVERSGRRTVPQIFIHGQSIGGYDDLWALAQSGKLDDLLESSSS